MFSLEIGNIAVTLSIVIVIIRLLDVRKLRLCCYCSGDFCGRLLYFESLEETNNC